MLTPNTALRAQKEEPMDVLQIPTLETERLRLRAFRKSDLDDYAALHSDPEVLRYVVGAGPQPWDRGRSWRHMACLVGQWLEGSGIWAVEHRESGVFLGMVGFVGPEGWPGFELAGKLARRWWGNGYATEAARAALAYAFTTLGKDRVISLILPENLASIRVAERIGQTLQGRMDLMGHEMLCYGIDRKEHARQTVAGIHAIGKQIGHTRTGAFLTL